MSGIFDQVINYAPPSLLSGTVTYKGTWSAATNTPTLTNPPSAITNGNYYVVSAGGTQFSLVFNIGDWIISNGTAWEKVDNTDAVSSVFGRTGAVVGVSTDYSAVGITNTALGASNPSTVAATTITATSTVAATGAVTGSNLSGTNTGDQTITLTGGVTGSGTGSFAATVVTNANLTGVITSVGNATSIASQTGTGSTFVVSGSPTITTPVIAQINDASGNETLKLSSIASAVNEVTIENAATGNPVHVRATGSDASVGLHLVAKGASGYVNVTDGVDETKRLMFNASGGTTSTRTMLSSTQTVDRTISLPDATDTLVGRATTDTLTNKTLTSPTLTAPILGTPASGTVTNLTGTASININGTVGATTASTVVATSLLLGGSSLTSFGVFGSLPFQQQSDLSDIGLGTYINNSSSASGIIFAKSRNATLGSHTIVQDGDRLGQIDAMGSDGAAFARAAAIRFEVDGTPGASADMPGRILFLTSANGSATLTERVRITSAGAISLSQAGNSQNTDGYRFTRSGGAATTALFMGGDDNAYLYNTSSGGIKLFTGNTDNRGLSIDGSGNVTISGSLSKGSGSFRIEHPLPSKSATHQLVHSFIEGPKCDLIYRGKVDLVDGKASVNIDTDSTMTEGTFEALCATVQCFTSNESGWGAIRGKVIGNILTIEAQDAASNDNVSWMVIGERKDKHIMDTDWTDDNGRPIVEPLKPAEPALESK